jgi:hypothetical protein
MELSVGDKVRVYFYPPNSKHRFVEGIVDRNEINSFRRLSFSLRTTREIILDHEIQSPRQLPYIIAYAKEEEEEFEGRIEVLEAAVQTRSKLRIDAEPGDELDHVAWVEPEYAEEPGPVCEMRVELETQPEPEKWGWRRLFNRAA